MGWPSQQMDSCEKFLKMTPQERAKLIEEQTGCGLCLSHTHVVKKCFKDDPKRVNQVQRCSETVGGSACGRANHKLLHVSANVYCIANSVLAKS